MDYQGNTNRGKAGDLGEKKVEKVVTGTVVKKQKTFGGKFKEIFFGGDFRTAMKYIAADVLLPSIRNLMVDATTKGVERIVYGETSQQRRRLWGGGGGYHSRIQYNNPVRRDRAYLPDQPPSGGFKTVRKTTDDLVLATREEAETVLEHLIDVLDKYGVASLADLYDLTGLPSSHIDNKWGWTFLNNTEIRQVRDGYLLDLPPVEEI